jgi:hypothetical protein
VTGGFHSTNKGRNTASPKAGKVRWPPSKRRLRELVEDAVVDAYTESEQRTGLFTMIEDHLALRSSRSYWV